MSSLDRSSLKSQHHSLEQSIELIFQHKEVHTHSDSLPLKRILACVLVGGGIYGAAMGSYGWIVGARTFSQQLPMMLFVALKVPLLFIITTSISLPSYFVINTILGLRSDFGNALRAILFAQAALNVGLCSMLGFTLVYYFSVPDSPRFYQSAVLFNAFIFGAAALVGQASMSRRYRPLCAKNPNHRFALFAWLLVFAMVGIQLGWTLRPFIGQPHADITFLRDEPFENAFLRLLGITKRVFFR